MILLVLLLSGCATTQQFNVADATIFCLLQGKVLVQVQTEKGEVTDATCAVVRVKPDHNT